MQVVHLVLQVGGRLQSPKLRNIIPPLNKTLLKSQFKITNKTTGTIISHIQKKKQAVCLLLWSGGR